MFSSAEALQKYAVSEAHVSVVTEHVKPNIDGREYLFVAGWYSTDHVAPLAYDFELDE